MHVTILDRNKVIGDNWDMMVQITEPLRAQKMGFPHGEPGEYELLDTSWKRISILKTALRDLIQECENADHWIRYTESFDRAKEVIRKLDENYRA